MENFFGLFIHWGIYALTEAHEQAFARLDIPRESYEALASQFNPQNYDPEDWVLQAKRAGMRYICFTTKHHDGFCMWNTRCTDYNIMHTPYGRDVLRELADACAKHGMRLSLYYSNPDWHHPYGYNPHSTHQWKAVNTQTPDLSVYIQFIKDQITELLTQYGPIYTLFWDIPPQIKDESLNQLARRLQPHIRINDRRFSDGDFSTPERTVPEGSRFTSCTEACDSVGQISWGFRINENYRTKRFITCAIDKIMAMGGSYLLNIGPTANGDFPPQASNLLARVGDWYTRMQNCLEQTEPDGFDYRVYGQKVIALRKNGRTYLHFYDGLTANGVILQQYPHRPRTVRLMNTNTTLPFEECLMPVSPPAEIGKIPSPPTVLHISNIPADVLCDEPIVLELCFD